MEARYDICKDSDGGNDAENATDTYFHNGLDSYLHKITRPNKLLRISENGDITYSIRQVYQANTKGPENIIYPKAHCESKVPDDTQKFPHGPTDLSSHIWFM